MRRAVGIIPARYASSRFPGKPLAPILGKPLLQWTYEAAKRSRRLERLIVATEDERILEAAQAMGAEAVMTSPGHASGTERAAEVAAGLPEDIVVNIQGDEPLLEAAMIDGLVAALQDASVFMASLMLRTADRERMLDRNTVKVVVDKDGYALYFSRGPLPFGNPDHYYQHVGLYGYQKAVLLELSRAPASFLEKCENLEQLRALEKGVRIKMIESAFPTLSVDTPEDIIKVEEALKSKG